MGAATPLDCDAPRSPANQVDGNLDGDLRRKSEAECGAQQIKTSAKEQPEAEAKFIAQCTRGVSERPTLSLTVTAEGLIERGTGQLPSVVKLPALSVTVAPMGLCERDSDPSMIVRNTTPKGRTETWAPGEIARIAKRAWREGFHGLAALVSVSWDTQFAPVDCRKLTAKERDKDARGEFFDTSRGKTGQAVIGTLSRRSVRVLDAYLAKLGIELHGDAVIFRNRSGKAYTADTLGDDFRTIRSLVFPGDKRMLLDIRRSGAVEAVAGEVDPASLSAKMGNTIDHNRFLQDSYLPRKTATVRLADEARKRGRTVIRGNKI